MTEDMARELTFTISKVLHGANQLDAQRALVAVMSCGICTSSKDDKQVKRTLEFVVRLLYQQVWTDFPRIMEMKRKGEVNEMILPKEIQ